MTPKPEEQINTHTDDIRNDKIDKVIKQDNSKEALEVSANHNGTVDLEDALNEIGVGRYTYKVLFVSCYALISASTEPFGIGLIVTSAQCELELDTYRKGIIGAVPMLGILVSSHTWGYVADTRGRRYAMLIALAGTWMLGLVSSFVTHWVALAIVKFFSVTFASGANAIVYALLGEMIPKSSRNRFMMLTCTSLMLSQIVIGVIGYITLRQNFSIPLDLIDLMFRPWRLLCQVFALTNLIAMLMFIFCVYESPMFYVSQGRENEALEVLGKMYAINTGKKVENYSAKAIIMHEDNNERTDVSLLRSMWNQTAPLFQKKYLKQTLVIMYVAIVAFSVAPPVAIWLPHIVNAFMRASPQLFAEDTFCSRVVTELSRANNVSTTLGICNDQVDDLAFYSMITLGGFITTVGLVSTLLVRTFGKKSVVIIFNTVGAVGCAALNSVYGFAALGVFLSIAANSIVMGIVSAFAVEIYPTYLRSMAVCLTIMAGRGFSFLVINVMGAQVESNCSYFFYGYGVFIFSAALVSFFLPGEQMKQNTTKTEKEGSLDNLKITLDT